MQAVSVIAVVTVGGTIFLWIRLARQAVRPCREFERLILSENFEGAEEILSNPYGVEWRKSS